MFERPRIRALLSIYYRYFITGHASRRKFLHTKQDSYFLRLSDTHFTTLFCSFVAVFGK